MAISVVLFALLLRATLTQGVSTVASGIVGTLLTPIQKVTSGISDSVSGFLGQFLRASQIAQENQALREENRQLLEQMADYEKYKAENESLRRDLGVKEQNPDQEFVKASVISRDPANNFYSFKIDKGSLDGVSVMDPVITPDGLVGRVTEVGPVFSKVLTILDVKLSVGVYDVRTQDVATLSGNISLAKDGLCRMSLLPRESGIAKGDIIQTTGTSGLFPKDIIIGRVVEVGYEPHGTTLYAVVQPTTDIKNVKDVLVVTSFRGQGSSLTSFGEEQDPAAQPEAAAGEESTAAGG